MSIFCRPRMLMTEMCRPHKSYSLDENCSAFLSSSWSNKMFLGPKSMAFRSPVSTNVRSGSTETNRNKQKKNLHYRIKMTLSEKNNCYIITNITFVTNCSWCRHSFSLSSCSFIAHWVANFITGIPTKRVVIPETT